MDNTHRQPSRFMDFAPAKRRPTQPVAPVAPAQPTPRPQAQRPQPQARPTTSRPAVAPSSSQPQPTLRHPVQARPQPVAQARPQATRPMSSTVFKRPATGASDPLSSRPVARPATNHPATYTAIPDRPAPRIVQSTTVRSVAATEDRVESFEFGIIEDLSSVVKPEPPMIPGTRPAPYASTPHATASRSAAAPSRPAAKAEPAEDNYLDMRDEAAALAAAEQSKRHGSDKPSLFSRKSKSNDSAPRKSPFLSSVNVPKRPLSASAPTGIHAPVTVQPPEAAPERPPKQRKNAPFIIIVILSVLLGVSLGAVVYFILPH